jgi:hypothetical protein
VDTQGRPYNGRTRMAEVGRRVDILHIPAFDIFPHRLRRADAHVREILYPARALEVSLRVVAGKQKAAVVDVKWVEDRLAVAMRQALHLRHGQRHRPSMHVSSALIGPLLFRFCPARPGARPPHRPVVQTVGARRANKNHSNSTSTPAPSCATRSDPRTGADSMIGQGTLRGSHPHPQGGWERSLTLFEGCS